MGKCCISGAGAVRVDYHARTMSIGNETWKEGDWLSLDGSTGEVYLGQVATKEAELTGDFGTLMDLADRYKKLAVRANADTPDDAKAARNFGAKGIGLCRTCLLYTSGPSGMSAAYHLRRLGHSVTLYEAGPLLGGMMRFGIPKYRLPRDILDCLLYTSRCV